MSLTLVAFLPDSCTLLGKPWIIVSSINSNFWSCPSVLHLFTLSNTWAMTADLCGYGDKWRKRKGLSMECFDSRDPQRFEKHCFTTKGGNCSFSHSNRGFALPTCPVFHVPCTVCRRCGFLALHQCQRTPFLQSDTGFLFGRYGVASSLFPQSRTARTQVATFRAILLQPVPNKLFTTVVLFVSLSKKNFLHHQRLTRLHTTLSQCRTRFLTTSCFTFFLTLYRTFASRSCGDSFVFLASVDHAFILIRSD